MPNMNDLLRQAQVMQNKVLKLQQEMAEKTVETSAGGGMVKVVMNGRQELRAIAIDPRALEGGDVEMLQDLVLAAVNEALTKAHEAANREMGKYTGGMNLGGLF